jgi:hypothetical protein
LPEFLLLFESSPSIQSPGISRVEVAFHSISAASPFVGFSRMDTVGEYTQTLCGFDLSLETGTVRKCLTKLNLKTVAKSLTELRILPGRFQSVQWIRKSSLVGGALVPDLPDDAD